MVGLASTALLLDLDLLQFQISFNELQNLKRHPFFFVPVCNVLSGAILQNTARGVESHQTSWQVPVCETRGVRVLLVSPRERLTWISVQSVLIQDWSNH